ncbi:FAD:protein FMN transferase [Rhodoferax lacus]|uniref:FAD:protein FMN transferase n=1 Tax=Rhodoferax lacus TaxID=2184758 RepID=A0A3E1RE49_9BURK|nr:FAD:protein FMN transferase [Rhodoferax lacus]RFO97302.1 FAD:protein FMN transferase [Rhodoferax lacus]
MKRRAFMQLGLGSALGAVQASAGASPLVWRSRTLGAMGTSMRLQLAHTDAAQAEQALAAAIADIRSIEDQMSLFREDSALCQLNRTGVLTQAPADLLQVLHTAAQVSERSQGAFDITVQPLWQVFDAARQQGRLPSAAEVSAARSKVDWRGVQVRGDTVRLQQRGMALTLNGIAQGYAADKVRARLQALGVQHALVDAGEYAALGQAAHAGDWTLGVASPRGAHALLAGIALQGRCVATSADDQCCFSADYRNHHIFDPRTGYSPQALSSVSVMADSAVQADAITKVLFMAGYEQALPLAKAWGVEVLVVDKQGRWQASAGLPLRAI